MTAITPDLPDQFPSDPRKIAGIIEYWYGPNPYSDYLRDTLCRPAPADAEKMGLEMGTPVMANDGLMYPGAL